MKGVRVAATIAAAAGVLFVACGSSTGIEVEFDEIVQGSNPQPAADSVNHVGFDLMVRAGMLDLTENSAISPFSIAQAFTLLMNGAQGDTLSLFEEFFNQEITDVENFNYSLRRLLMEMTLESDAFTSANSLWLVQPLMLQERYQENMKAYYGADVERLGSAGITSINRINEWVAAATRGRIERLIESLSPDDVMVLVNAVAFDGEWSIPFDESATEDAPFLTPQGSQTVRMMQSPEEEFLYAEGAGFQAVQMNYGNGPYAMIVLLPDSAAELSRLVRSWAEDASAFSEFRQSLARRPGQIFLPQFEVREGSRLRELYVDDPRFGRLFTGPNDFRRLSVEMNGDFFISEVFHEAYVKVDEEGTEAGAATGVVIAPTSIAEPQEPFVFRADRPFAFFIIHEGTGAITFSGTITNP